ncbi:MAG: hypothetical protein BJ554DRAFT_5232, partial [Olpidium bornovanus]
GLEVRGIVDALNGLLRTGNERVVVQIAFQEKRAFERLRGTPHQLVKYVVIALLFRLVSHPGLFQQVALDVRAHDLASSIELDPDELSEPGRIVVPDGLRVAEGFQNGIRLQNLLLQHPELVLVALDGRPAGAVHRGDGREVLNDLFRVLGLSRARLAGDEDGLVFAVLQHVAVRRVRHRKDVGRPLTALFVFVRRNHLLGVDRQPLIRVHRNEEKARIRLPGFAEEGVCVRACVRACVCVWHGARACVCQSAVGTRQKAATDVLAAYVDEVGKISEPQVVHD